jgi:hypothetical protein
MRFSPRCAALALVAAALTLGAAGCGSRNAGPRPPPGGPAAPVPAVVRDYPATRWIPARPTYAFAARTVGDAQRAVADLLTTLVAMLELDQDAALRGLLAVDGLSAGALADLGIDVAGSVALFSEAVSPTVVVHLAAPAQTRKFLDQLRAGGFSARAEQAAGVEVVTISLPGGLSASWAIDGEWLWLHLGLPGAPGQGAAWLSASRSPGAPAWADDWAWAVGRGGQGERPALAGFVDVRALLASLSPRISAAIACAQLLEPVGRLGAAFELAGDRVGGRLSVEIGGAAAGLQRAVLPAPAGFSAAAARAPLAVQWNLDLAAVRGHLAPCAQALAVDLSPLDRYGVRTVRAILQRYDPRKPTASRGAVSMDLAHRTYAAQLLDEIPGRSLIQRKRTFGPYQGYALSIPFGGPTIEYVLDDRRALAGLGEGVLAEVVGQGPGAPGPILAVDLAPPAMSREAWAGLLRWIDRRPDALLAWSELHLALGVDGAALVLDVSARRRQGPPAP